jgi:pyruvate formate lyase activating enzyme
VVFEAKLMAYPSVRCKLCPRECELAHLERGDCRVRINYEGRLVTLVYGKPCAVHVDPIEKKPLFHFLPATGAFSIATAGCNLHCKFCQNWDISQFNPEDTRNIDLTPERVVAVARSRSCRTIAYTYSEPIIFYEYTYDTSVIARGEGIKNVLVTAGFINEEPLRKLCQVIDGANVDLKSFSDEYYQRLCSGRIQPILDTLKIMREEGVIVEITNLIIPTLNDDIDMIQRMCAWIVKELGPDTPLHFSRFYPHYKLKNLPPTPAETLVRAREAAMKEGLYYVYIGNLPGMGGEDTICPNCKNVIIERVGYHVPAIHMTDGACDFCGKKIYGVWS